MNYFIEALQWIGDGANWGGPTGIGTMLWDHVWYSALALAIAAAIAVPLGWAVGHSGRGRGLVVGLTGAARALPTLGVLTLVGLMYGIGLTAPMVAFVVLAVPSILAGAYAGIQSADRTAVDAARANGMTEWQILTRVEVPLGLPVLVGGLRSAMLQVIATATLAAYVGTGGLGRPMFLGLRTRDYGLMLGGSLLVVALAVVFELLFALIQRLVRPVHLREPTENLTESPKGKS